MGKPPAFQFYPGDWKRDKEVQSLSFEERGVWFEMLLLMFDSAEKGKLVFSNGNIMSDDDVARSIGISRQRYVKILHKLLQHGVASKDEDTGIIYCRRMVRDANLSNKRAKCGSLGGNPNLVKQNSSKTEAKPKFKDRQNPTPSSSSSSSDNNINPPLSSESSPPSCECSIPTLDEVLEYASLPDVAVLPEEAKRFFYKRAEEHWRDRFGRVIDWRASLRGWKSNPFYGQKTQKSKEHCEKSNDRNAGTLNDPAKYDIDGNWKPSY